MAVPRLSAEINSLQFLDNDGVELSHHHLDKISGIVFMGDMVSVDLTDGSSLQMPYSDISRFVFFEGTQSGSDGVEVADVTISMRYDEPGKAIQVRSGENILSLSVFSLSGRMLHASSPGKQEAEVSVASFPAGVYIMTATTGSMTRSVKFIIK